MRLIDADNFINNLRLLLNRTTLGEISPHESISVGEIATLIKNAPTAYDVDKVVEQLEEKREKHRKDAHVQMYKQKHEDWAQYLDGMQCGIRDSIEIVKSGGIE